MLRHHKFRPYIRRLHGNEEAHDLITQVQLSFYTNLIQNKEISKAYVLTQRGFSGHVIAVSSNKETLIRKALEANSKTSDFHNWTKEIQSQILNAQSDATSAPFIDLNSQ